jgi:hypothetical protein
MNQQHGKLFDTVEHKTHGEYQTLVPDVEMESEYLSGLARNFGDVFGAGSGSERAVGVIVGGDALE